MAASKAVLALRRRHERSPQPSSKLLVATIDAVNETLEIGSVEKSGIAYFGACMSALERSDVLGNADTVGALCTLLAAVLQLMPGSHIKAKFATVSDIICRTYRGLGEDGDTLSRKAVLQCLVQTLCHPDLSHTWAPVKEPFMLLLQTTTASAPRIRKAAADGLVEVMARIQGTPAQQPASADVAAGAPLAGEAAQAMFLQVTPGCDTALRTYSCQPLERIITPFCPAVGKLILAAPKLAAKQASEATKSQREDAEAAIIAAVQDSLHFTGALRPIMPVLAEGPALEIAEQLLKLFALGQPLLSQHAANCLLQLVQGAANTGSVAPGQIQVLLKVCIRSCVLAGKSRCIKSCRCIALLMARHSGKLSAFATVLSRQYAAIEQTF
jgi:hypothetical protein